MARKREPAKPAGKKSLLDLAREHEDELLAAGLPAHVLDDLEVALRGRASGSRPSPAAQVLMRDLQREVGEIQAAIRKEFPGNAAFQSVFKADSPLPSDPPRLLALGRLVAREVIAPKLTRTLYLCRLRNRPMTYVMEEMCRLIRALIADQVGRGAWEATLLI